jgi:hypothetical protein
MQLVGAATPGLVGPRRTAPSPGRTPPRTTLRTPGKEKPPAADNARALPLGRVGVLGFCPWVARGRRRSVPVLKDKNLPSLISFWAMLL